jgi:hypothetical protein
MDEILDEAATIKARAQSAARILKSLLAEKTLPEDLRKAAEGLQAALRKSWKDLEAEATPKDESGPYPPALSPSAKNADGERGLEEAANMGDTLYARMHSSMTYNVDDLFGQGLVTMDEYIGALEALAMAMTTFRAMLAQNAPGMLARRPWDGPEDAQPQSAQMESDPHPGEFLGDAVTLMEAVRADGTVPVKIIQPGWGTSGYYPAEVLQRDGPHVFTKGMHMYWNHPTAQEETARPERDLNDLAGVLMSDARWNANGPKGPGLYADAKVMPHYADKVESLAQHIGLSIRAMGKAQAGEAEGKSGPIITEFSAGRSVDFVTAAGAGGEIVAMFEAARERADKKNTSKTEPGVTKNLQEAANMELKELQEANATLQKGLDAEKAENARLREALAMREARNVLIGILAAKNLPAVTKQRLMESLSANPPMKDGKLDEAAFKPLAEKAVKDEIAYLTEAAGLGRISGMGDGGDNEDDDGDVDKSLAESFSTLGLSDKAVEIAVKGRR